MKRSPSPPGKNPGYALGVLGPILFLLYVNDIPSISNLFSSCLFADDTSLIFSDSDIKNLFISCNLGLDCFSVWCCANRLSVNISKTNYMIFSNGHLPGILPYLLFNNTPIDRCSSLRFLGVELDEKLKFSKHISLISGKFSKTAGILRKLAEFMPPYILTSLYHALVEPHLNYCCLLFGGAYDTHLNSLVVAQRKCIRVIDGESYYAHSNPIFARLNILKFKDLYKLNLGIYLHKNWTKFQQYLNTSNYNTRGDSIFNPPFHRLNLTQRQSVEHQAPKLWNSIPASIRNSSSLNSFKWKYKKHLISQY